MPIEGNPAPDKPCDKMKVTTPTATEPTIAMCDFFALTEVKAAQLIQSRNPYGSKAHREASDAIRTLAKQYGAEKFFGEY